VARGSLAPLPLEELQQLAAVFGMVKTDYVEPIDEKKLISDAISGMVASLDPHSQYFDKKSFKEFREGTSGRFVGVGIEISQEDGLVKVVSPIEGSPAFRAGLKPNDLITKIDDTLVKGLTLNEAVKRMRGEPNTKVLLTIYRKDENRTFPVTITREEIKTVSVKGKVIEPGYAWIRLSQFQERTVDDFARKVEEIYKRRAQPQGPGAGPAQRPGRPAGRCRGHLGRLPARKRHGGVHQRPAGRKQVHLQGRARVLPAPQRRRPAQAPARRPEKRAAGGAGQ
jgi:carboxyl-terminal processing protease